MTMIIQFFSKTVFLPLEYFLCETCDICIWCVFAHLYWCLCLCFCLKWLFVLMLLFELNLLHRNIELTLYYYITIWTENSLNILYIYKAISGLFFITSQELKGRRTFVFLYLYLYKEKMPLGISAWRDKYSLIKDFISLYVYWEIYPPRKYFSKWPYESEMSLRCHLKYSDKINE